MLICDCTLRDGGYYTNWDFNKDIVEKYLRTMEQLNSIDIIELGYRSKPSQDYFGEYFYCPEYFLKEAKKLAPSKRLAIMLNEKECKPGDLDYLLGPCKGIIDIVRLAVNPAFFERALELVMPIRKMGFKVAFNIMYMSKWTKDESFIEKLKIADGKVDFLYLVDSYGSMTDEEVITAFKQVKQYTNIPLGFHGHNNLELALVNTIKAIDSGAEIVDSTITGMGRGAGNLKTELLLSYLNSKNYIDIDFSSISDLVSVFEKMQVKYKWGTNLPYMISGAFSLPQAEVMEWMSKHRYTIHSIVMALQNKKENVSDNLELDSFSPSKKYKEAIIIGGGPTAQKSKSAIEKYVHNKDICFIMAGGRFIKEYSDIKLDKYVCLVGAEGLKFEEGNENGFNYTFLVPPKPRKMGTIIPKGAENVFELKKISFTQETDSLLSVALQTAIDLKINDLSIIGFDGYDMVADLGMQEVANENQQILDDFISLGKSLNSYTPTEYKNLNQKSIYSYL